MNTEIVKVLKDTKELETGFQSKKKYLVHEVELITGQTEIQMIVVDEFMTLNLSMNHDQARNLLLQFQKVL